jgi:pimeloyl-ACP methyl ester carboxylesterase
VASLYSRASDIELRGPAWSARLCTVRLPAWPDAVGDTKFLLVHGNPSHVDDWAQTIPALRGLGEVVAYDQVGFGKSGGLQGALPSLSNCADVAVALADRLGWDRFVVLGHSHGGLVAHTLAARHPARVRATILLNTAGTPAHPVYRLLAQRWLHASFGPLGTPVVRALLGSGLTRPLGRLVAELLVRSAYAPGPAPAGAVEQQLELFHAHPEVLSSITAVAQDDPCGEVARHAARITAPILFVHGRDDRLVPRAYARQLFDLTKPAAGAFFVEVPGGHMVHAVRPELVNPLLVDWLTKLPPETPLAVPSCGSNH